MDKTAQNPFFSAQHTSQSTVGSPFDGTTKKHLFRAGRLPKKFTHQSTASAIAIRPWGMRYTGWLTPEKSGKYHAVLSPVAVGDLREHVLRDGLERPCRRRRPARPWGTARRTGRRASLIGSPEAVDPPSTVPGAVRHALDRRRSLSRASSTRAPFPPRPQKPRWWPQRPAKNCGHQSRTGLATAWGGANCYTTWVSPEKSPSTSFAFLWRLLSATVAVMHGHRNACPITTARRRPGSLGGPWPAVEAARAALWPGPMKRLG